jgi:hypothetical protein
MNVFIAESLSRKTRKIFVFIVEQKMKLENHEKRIKIYIISITYSFMYFFIKNA